MPNKKRNIGTRSMYGRFAWLDADNIFSRPIAGDQRVLYGHADESDDGGAWHQKVALRRHPCLSLMASCQDQSGRSLIRSLMIGRKKKKEIGREQNKFWDANDQKYPRTCWIDAPHRYAFGVDKRWDGMQICHHQKGLCLLIQVSTSTPGVALTTVPA